MEKKILAAVRDTSSTDGKVSDLRTKEVPSEQASYEAETKPGTSILWGYEDIKNVNGQTQAMPISIVL